MFCSLYLYMLLFFVSNDLISLPLIVIYIQLLFLAPLDWALSPHGDQPYYAFIHYSTCLIGKYMILIPTKILIKSFPGILSSIAMGT